MGLDIVFADLEWLMVALFVLGSILIAISNSAWLWSSRSFRHNIPYIWCSIASKVVSTTALVIVAIVLVAITLLIIWFYRI